MRQLLTSLMLTLLLGTYGSLEAQSNMPPTEDITQDVYFIEEGDNLYDIAGVRGDSALWPKIVAENPYLGKPGRRFDRDGRIIVLLHPGEALVGLEKLGLRPTIGNIDQLVRKPVFTPATETIITKTEYPKWLWWLLLLIPVGLGYAYLKRLDPTTVGVGKVEENGIRTPTEVAQHFRRVTDNTPNTHGLPVVQIVRGRGYGWSQVRDRNWNAFLRRLNGEPTWRATIQHPDGTQEYRYSLMGCANDVRAGGGIIARFGFRFVPEEDVTSQIQTPAPPPAPAPPSPTTTLDHAPVTVTTDTEDGEFFRFELKPAENDKKTMIVVRGVDLAGGFSVIGTRSKGVESMTLRFDKQED